MGYRKTHLETLDEYFFIFSVGCTKSPIIYVDHQHNQMTFVTCDFLVYLACKSLFQAWARTVSQFPP